MTTLSQYISQRPTAGTRYQAAVTELLASLIDLAALDRTIENARAGGAIPQPSFTSDQQGLPHSLVHPVFAPATPGAERLADKIQQQADTYIGHLS